MVIALGRFTEFEGSPRHDNAESPRLQTPALVTISDSRSAIRNPHYDRQLT
jgi:hypothetical protein